jgi:hypothetical protein
LRPGGGYTPENARLVCHGFNQLKWQDEDGDALEWIAEAARAIKRHREPT